MFCILCVLCGEKRGEIINIVIYFFGARLRFRRSFHEFQRRRVLLSPYPPLCSAHRAAPGIQPGEVRRKANRLVRAEVSAKKSLGNTNPQITQISQINNHIPAQIYIKIAFLLSDLCVLCGEKRGEIINIVIYFFGARLRFRCSFHEFQRRSVPLSPYPPLCSAHHAAPGIQPAEARRGFSKKRALAIRNHRESNSIDREHGFHGCNGFPRIFVSVRICVIRVIRVLS